MGNISLKTNLSMPKNMGDLLHEIQIPKKDSGDYPKYLEKKESAGFGFNNTLDPVFIAVWYGLYKSKELPPHNSQTGLLINDKIKCDDAYHFNYFNVNYLIDKTNNALLALWIKENGLPESSAAPEYRKKIYDFIEKLLDSNAEYYIKVLIPFYLMKANEKIEGTQPFLYRLLNSCRYNSTDYEFEMGDDAPEYLIQEFAIEQKKFEKYVQNPKQPSTLESTISSKLLKEESETLEFKSSFKYNVKRFEQTGKKIKDDTVGKEISIAVAAFANKIGGTILIGVNDNKEILGIQDDIELLSDQTKEFFERKIWESLKNLIKDNSFISNIKLHIEQVEDKEICELIIPPAKSPIYVDSIQECYVRMGNRSEKFNPSDFVKYCSTRFQ